MSKGTACKCKPKDPTNWVVLQYKCNHSAFNGYKYTPSAYSSIRCTACGHTWRTKSKIVSTLKQVQ